MNEEKIDLKDKKLLYELDFDARMSYSQLGKRVGLSKQVVEYRINRLIRKGIIKGFYPVINVPKLGYIYCRLTFSLQGISPKELDLMLNDLKKDNEAFWVFETQGEFDLFIALWCKNLSNFRSFVNKFMIKYSRFIRSKVENIATDVIHYQHRYLLGKKETKEIRVAETNARVLIDELDKKILSMLCENARTSLVDIGKRLNENPKTLAYRISRMEKLKLIEGYRSIIDHNVLGYTYYKVFLNLNNYDLEELMKIKELIKSNPSTIYIIEGIGLHSDIDFEIIIKDNKELLNFIKKLRTEFPKIIGNYNTVMFLDTVKVRYLPF